MIFKTYDRKRRKPEAKIPEPWIKFEPTIFYNKLTGATLSIRDNRTKEWRFSVILDSPGGAEYDHAFQNLGEALEHMQNFMIESKI